MKRFGKYAWMMLAVMAAGCSDSKDEPNGEPETPVEPEKPVEIVMPDIDGKTFSAGDNFLLTMGVMHSGGVLEDAFYLTEGQHVTVSLTNDGNGIVDFATDDFDFSSLNIDGVEGKIARPSFWGLGKTVSIPVELTTGAKEEAGYYLANGSVEVNGVRLSLKGDTITDKGFKGKMEMASLPEFGSFPSYGLMEAPVYRWITPETSDGIHYGIPQLIVDWNSSNYQGDIATAINSSDFMQVILNSPILSATEYGLTADEDYISVNRLFSNVLSEFTFTSDGMYMSGEKYYFTKLFCSNKTDSDFLLYVDPYSILKSQKRESTTYSAAALYAAVFNMMNPLNAEGIPMSYCFDNGNIGFEMGLKDVNLSNEFVKTLFLTLLSDEGNRDRLISSLSEIDAFSTYAEEISSLINNYEELFGNTSDASVRFRFK